ncbi:MAG: hypothetical protein RLY70_1172 [Planctomycetota bacterium]|jgi:hypothetical protein
MRQRISTSPPQAGATIQDWEQQTGVPDSRPARRPPASLDVDSAGSAIATQRRLFSQDVMVVLREPVGLVADILQEPQRERLPPQP